MMTRLTDLAIRNLKSQTERMVADGEGLYLRVRPGATNKIWIFRFTQSGKTWKIQLGTYPYMGLSEARERARALAREHKAGLNPVFERDRRREEARLRELEASMKPSVEKLFFNWMAIDLKDHKDGGFAVRRAFEKDVLPAIGHLRVEDVQKTHLTSIVDSIVGRGSLRMAKVVFSLMRQMFRFAQDRDVISADPSQSIRKSKIGGKDVERDRVLSESEIRHLAEVLPKSGLRETTQLAIWIMLSTCCRIGELTRARWADIDLAAGVWHIPKENSKNGRPQVIYLSEYAQKLFGRLRAQQSLFHESAISVTIAPITWVYPNRNGSRPLDRKTISKQISDRQRANDIFYKRAKEAFKTSLILTSGKWRPHDLRRTGATLMVSLGVLPEVVERCLNHTEVKRLRRIYQQHEYRKEMAEAWHLLGSHLQAISQAKNRESQERSREA